MMKRTHCIAIILVGITLCSYTLLSFASQKEKGFTITYRGLGGGRGADDTVIVIDSTGTACSKLCRPNSYEILTGQEYQSLLSLFDGFDSLSNSYGPEHSACRDQMIENIIVQKGTNVKSIMMDLCGLPKDTSSREIDMLKKIFTSLSALSDSVYEHNKPWKGVTAQFSTDKEVYLMHEPIQLIVDLTNSSSETKTIQLKHTQTIAFRVYSDSDPGFSYFFPVYGSVDTSKPTTIVLQPNSRQRISYTWAYDDDLSAKIVPSTYRISFGLYTDGGYCSDFDSKNAMRIEIIQTEDK